MHKWDTCLFIKGSFHGHFMLKQPDDQKYFFTLAKEAGTKYGILMLMADE